MVRASWVLILCVGTWSCATIPDEKKPEDTGALPFGPTGVPEALRGQGTTDIMGNPSRGAAAPLPAKDILKRMTPEDEIVFTDPDNPDAEIPELATILSEQSKGPWEESETVAKRKAMRQGKPLLIWFTHSKNSPMSSALSSELFGRDDFGAWADEKLIRLKVDFNYEVNDPDMLSADRQEREVKLKKYVEGLKKRYKILGQPYLVMLNSSGEVIGRYRGYKRGNADYYWGLFKQAEAASTASYESWKKKMQSKGYRDWKDNRNRKVFAKLASYSKGELVLIEPDGRRSKTQEKKLSQEDQDWINKQLELRGL